MSATPEASGGIAIIGMAGRFPGAETIAELWTLLRDGREGISRFSADELRAAGIPDALSASPDYVAAKGMVRDADCFDAAFFGIAPQEAAHLDPQHRIFLQCCWHALEDAGHDPSRFPGWIGVYAGEAEQSYQAALLARRADVMAAAKETALFFGNSPDFLSTRVSYHLDLRGPSLTVQTACSTSLVSIHLACQALLGFEADMALAGGASISWPNVEGYQFAHGSVESPDGRCRPFDAGANGTLPSNGVGVIVLRRLDDALAAGDPIHAVIRGSAINNDGGRKVGFAAPSVEGQADVIAFACRVAGVATKDIGYVEAHGTGTIMGDPIEIAALAKAYGDRDAVAKCRIGSLKSNLGHLKAAAGVAAVIKTVLALKHRAVPPSLHFSSANPALRLEETPFVVNDALWPWDSVGPRRAAVSSFGIGGTNAHAILEEAPVADATPEQPLSILPVSARDEADANAARLQLADALESGAAGQGLSDAARTLQAGRRHFPHRSAVIAAGAKDAVNALRGLGASYKSRIGAGARPLSFLFPGQGSEYVGMGAALYVAEPVFRASLDRYAAVHDQISGGDLRRAVFEGQNSTGPLEETQVAQPALVAVQLALADLLRHWGLAPARLAGHSVGEITAACLAGVFSPDDAIALALARGAAMQASPKGAMLAVALAESALGDLGAAADLAAVNTARQCVVSGSPGAIAALEARWTADGVRTQRLSASRAFHSRLLEPSLGRLRDALDTICMVPPLLPLATTVTGGWARPEDVARPEHWMAHARQPVRFLDALGTLLQEDAQFLLEVGPGETLSGFARRHSGRSPRTEIIAVNPAPDSMVDGALRGTYGALAEAYVQGCDIDWDAFGQGKGGRRISLPGYPFKRTRFSPDPTRADPTPAPPPAKASDDASKSLVHLPAWERVGVAESLPLHGLTWILCRPDNTLVESARQRAAADGGVVRIVPPPEAREIGADSRGMEATFAALLRAGTPRRIVHLWCHGAAATDDRRLGYESLLALASAIEAEAVTTAIDLVFAADGLFAVDSGDRPSPEKALAIGPSRVIGQELPNVRARIVDLPRDLPDRQVLDECLSLGSASMAVRGRHRLTLVHRATALAVGKPGFRRGGHYLITGGLGRLGLAMAGQLARRHGARLTLVGRSGAAPRQRGGTPDAALGPDSSPNPAHAAVAAIEAQGGAVFVAACDITDAGGLRRAVDAAETRFGPLDGVLHAAAATRGFMTLAQTDRGESERVFAAKIRGQTALDAVLGDRPLTVRLAMGSLASVLGGLGFGAYAAANAWLDTHAEASSGWTTIAWDAWQEGLEAVSVSAARHALSTKDAFDAIECIAGSGLTGQVVVCGGDLKARAEGWLPAADIPVPASTPSPTTGTPSASIAAVFSEVLGHPDIAETDDFFDRGGDSLQAIQVISRLRQRLGLPVTPALFFENSTPLALATRVAGLEALDRGTPIETAASEESLRTVQTMSGDEVTRLLEKLVAGGRSA